MPGWWWCNVRCHCYAVDVSTVIRDLASECGADFEADGTYVLNDDKKQIAAIDDGDKNTVLSRLAPTADLRIIFPMPVSKPIAYRGVGIVRDDGGGDHVQVAEKNERMIDLLIAPTGSYSGKPNKVSRINSRYFTI